MGDYRFVHSVRASPHLGDPYRGNETALITATLVAVMEDFQFAQRLHFLLLWSRAELS